MKDRVLYVDIKITEYMNMYIRFARRNKIRPETEQILYPDAEIVVLFIVRKLFNKELLPLFCFPESTWVTAAVCSALTATEE